MAIGNRGSYNHILRIAPRHMGLCNVRTLDVLGVILSGAVDGPGAVVVPFPRNVPVQVTFDRAELMGILDLYGRMVAAGLWRDYAIGFEREAAHFSAYKRTAERPSARIEKRPALRQRQGMWALYGEAGQVLKRGHDLAGVLASLERKLLKIVAD